MTTKESSLLNSLSAIGKAEGISLLLLLFIAMPLKYVAGKPEAVKIIGWIHGLLFVLFMMAVLLVFFKRRWPFKMVVLAFIAAFLPFGTFVFDRWWKKRS